MADTLLCGFGCGSGQIWVGWLPTSGAPYSISVDATDRAAGGLVAHLRRAVFHQRRCHGPGRIHRQWRRPVRMEYQGGPLSHPEDLYAAGWFRGAERYIYASLRYRDGLHDRSEERRV